ncbi:MAG: 4-hydroxy-tetrahydrodipicolinate reductase [Candidatus Dormibacteria bacterium]
MADIPVVVCGALGKMGRTVTAAVNAAEGMSIVGEADLADDLAAALDGAQVMVDFTAPDAAFDNAQTALAAGVAPIIGTTGMSTEQVGELARHAERAEIGGAVIPNFAIGAVLMMRLAEIAAPYFDAVEVVETHSQTKLDAPSGTAVTTAERLAAAREHPFRYARPQTSILDNARGAEHRSVAVHSLRLPGVVADQEVLFGTLGQTLSIAHRTTTREAFMPGVIATIRAVSEQRCFFRSLDEVLGLG